MIDAVFASLTELRPRHALTTSLYRTLTGCISRVIEAKDLDINNLQRELMLRLIAFTDVKQPAEWKQLTTCLLEMYKTLPSIVCLVGYCAVYCLLHGGQFNLISFFISFHIFYIAVHHYHIDARVRRGGDCAEVYCVIY